MQCGVDDGNAEQIASEKTTRHKSNSTHDDACSGNDLKSLKKTKMKSVKIELQSNKIECDERSSKCRRMSSKSFLLEGLKGNDMFNIVEGDITKEVGYKNHFVSPKIVLKSKFGKAGQSSKAGIKMRLSYAKLDANDTKKLQVPSVFNNDSDEEVEEMPAECKMRMRNIGRDTPTSSGPNTFGKTKHGFMDSRKIFEKSVSEKLQE